MDPALIASLPTLLSVERFGTYLRKAGSDRDKAARYYSWNIEVSGAFWGPLHVLEIATRNAMQRQLASRFARDDWWKVPRLQLTKINTDSIEAAAKKARTTARAQQRSAVPGDVVSGLMFGFWTALAGKGGSLQYESKLWNPVLKHAFPHYLGNRANLHAQLDEIREFRNRIAHHEPIVWRNPAGMRSKILTVAGYIDPDVANYIDKSDRISICLSREASALSGVCRF